MGIHNKSRGGSKLLMDGTEVGTGSMDEDLELLHEIAIDDPN